MAHDNMEALSARSQLESYRIANFKKIAALRKKARALVDEHAAHRELHRLEDTPEQDKDVYRAFVSCRYSSDCDVLLHEYVGGGFLW